MPTAEQPDPLAEAITEAISFASPASQVECVTYLVRSYLASVLDAEAAVLALVPNDGTAAAVLWRLRAALDLRADNAELREGVPV